MLRDNHEEEETEKELKRQTKFIKFKSRRIHKDQTTSLRERHMEQLEKQEEGG